ncbi:hypothetical protein [Flavobacterium degerlachei]|uniref:Uncharacterized protein n=1 Tax=Flavobacterium degerlachei TaxID=229203 RepID=A0A1H3ECE8_9FLAO|nr:hypothetical protein [Flavobacterium degerlachei]SDX75928.1 hypothetical protein SAMN05444338_11498 [Flavobacterium degerlachei]
MKEKFKISEDYRLYYDLGYAKTRLLWELFSNASRTIHSVYIFKHFEEYSRQLNSDKQEDKGDIYWNASYYEKLIDYIKIVVAFETYNKALLIKNEIVIHKVDSGFNKNLSRKQSEGKPIFFKDFFENNFTDIDLRNKKAKLNGFTKYLNTISFNQTLNPNYQAIIKLEENFVYYLKDINQKRNRLHFFSDFKGAFSVHDHLRKWEYIKDLAIHTIDNELKLINEELKIMSLIEFEK